MATKIQFRRDTSSNWIAVNPILSDGELGLETDTKKYKIGNGINTWNTLTYIQLSGDFGAIGMQETLDPAAPISGLTLYAKRIAGKVMPKVVGPSGLDSILQNAIFGNGMSIALPGSSTSLSYVGMGAMTAVGTVSHPALTANSLRESTRRAILTSAATAGSASEFRLAVVQCMRGNADNIGGFLAVFRFGASSIVATQRLAVGLWASTSATTITIEPDAIVNGVWVGNNLAHANLQLMHNDGSGVASKVDLGADFIKNQPNALYELILFCKPNDNGISYRVKRLDAAGEVSGKLMTDIPAQTTLLAPHFYLNNGGTAAAVVLDFYRYYLESDY